MICLAPCFWRSWTHPDGEEAGYLSFELYGSGKYFLAGESVFSIRPGSIDYHDGERFQSKYVLTNALGFSLDTKPGALTVFLEMLEEEPEMESWG